MSHISTSKALQEREERPDTFRLFNLLLCGRKNTKYINWEKLLQKDEAKKQKEQIRGMS